MDQLLLYYTVDINGKVTACNNLFRNTCDLYGSGDPIGKHLSEVLDKTEHPIILKNIQKSIAHPSSVFDIEFNGTGIAHEKVFRWSVTAETEHSKIKNIHLVGKDISIEKALEKELLYKAALFANINDAIISTDKNF
nr:hypothetical protein [Flavisolibacter sp.]